MKIHLKHEGKILQKSIWKAYRKKGWKKSGFEGLQGSWVGITCSTHTKGGDCLGTSLFLEICFYVCCVSCAVSCVLCVVCCVLRVLCCVLCVVCYVLCVVCPLSFVVCRVSFVLCCLLVVV